jgi:hypothetical protein
MQSAGFSDYCNGLEQSYRLTTWSYYDEAHNPFDLNIFALRATHDMSAMGRIPYRARARRYWLQWTVNRDTTSQFPLRIQHVSTESQVPLHIRTFPLPFPLSPSFGLKLQAKGDRRIWGIRERQGSKSLETHVDLHIMCHACRAIHPRRGRVRTRSERKAHRAPRALRLACFIGE